MAHIVWEENVSEVDKLRHIEELNKNLGIFLPDGLSIYAFCDHDKMLPYSPTTLKKDKNKMSKQKTGYYQVKDNKKEEMCL